ncbi:MAG: peroxidase family protein, partial [Myxococcota bacterium]
GVVPAEALGLERRAFGLGNGAETITSGLEGAWTYTPIKWSHDYFTNMFEYEWELTKSPAGAHQWSPKNAKAEVPDAHIAGKKHKPVMLTTDLSLRFDPAYEKISRRFYENPEEFKAAFGKAWYKLTHRDMGPYARLVGTEVPAPQPWQDPVPPVNHPLVDDGDIDTLKAQILKSGLSVPALVRAAWGSASTYRDSDKRGGANGARIRLSPAKDWDVNNSAELAQVVSALEKIQSDFNAKGNKKISIADLLVLGGAAAIEDAAKKAGHSVKVPFTPGRSDATQEMTNVESYSVLEPKADGFRNFVAKGQDEPVAELLVSKADLLNLNVPEMAVLVAGMRALNANYDGSKHGVFTDRPGTLSNDFFVNLLDMSVEWSAGQSGIYEGRNRETGELVRTATGVDLIFGSNSQLRAIAEVYAANDADKKFVDDFVAAWNKVMMLDRFELDGKPGEVLTRR